MGTNYKSEADEARALARECKVQLAHVNGPLTRRLARTLKGLAGLVDSQSEQLSAAVYALRYYQDPEVFPATHPDGGLRARTVLAAIGSPKSASKSPRRWFGVFAKKRKR